MGGAAVRLTSGWPVSAVPMQRRMTFADFLRALMDERDLNQSQIATYAGVGKSTVSYWLRGSEPKGKSVDKLCQALGLDRDLVRDIVDGRIADPAVVQEAALTVRVDDPILASAFRRMMRWGGRRVEHLERIGREIYEAQIERDLPDIPDEGDEPEGAD